MTREQKDIKTRSFNCYTLKYEAILEVSQQYWIQTEDSL